VHKDFISKLKYARIWGSGKHDGVMAKRDHVLEDGDIIELHI
jgi:ribosome-interacting GTPase 1